FTYTHGSPIQAWTQMNQPLAHPEGTNFSEWTNILRYDYKGWTFREKFVWASFGRDSLFRNQGGNIFRSYKNPVYDLHNEMLQGIKSTLNFHELMVSKSLPFLKGWEIFAVHAYRFQKNLYGVWNDHYFQLGIRVQGLLEPVIDY
ncbi:MAG: hypothetical protein IT223_01380, partial [Crocinitomicaceae bacterium]|nr:hypothetical protein [Crocinitomicaceae bacterium]